MDNKIIQIIIISLIMCFLTTNFYAQSNSAIDSLRILYNTKIDSLNNVKNLEIKALSVDNYTENKQKVILKYKKLITDIRIKKEADIDEIKELIKIRNEKKEIAKELENANKLKERNIQIAREKKELEEMRKKLENQKKFLESDRGKLYEKIEIEFEAWLKKSEMETGEEYRERVQSIKDSKFNEIVVEQIEDQKKRLKSIASACLGEYNAEQEFFNIELRSKKYFLDDKDLDYNISIPRDFANFMKSEYECSYNSKDGLPILVHAIDFVLENNDWIPSKIIFIFPNGPRYNMNNKPYYDNYYWRKTRILKKKNDYILEYTYNVTLKPIPLKNIFDNFKNSKLKNGFFYYEWNLDKKVEQNLNLSIESLGIEVPKF